MHLHAELCIPASLLIFGLAKELVQTVPFLMQCEVFRLQCLDHICLGDISVLEFLESDLMQTPIRSVCEDRHHCIA